MPSKKIGLGLSYGMISFIVYNKYMYREPSCNNSLKLLKIHLDTSISCYKSYILISICNAGSDCCRKTVSHGCDRRIDYKSLTLFDVKRMTSYNAGRAVTYNYCTIFGKLLGQLPKEGINIGLSCICILIFCDNRIRFFPKITKTCPIRWSYTSS